MVLVRQANPDSRATRAAETGREGLDIRAAVGNRGRGRGGFVGTDQESPLVEGESQIRAYCTDIARNGDAKWNCVGASVGFELGGLLRK